jgi:hypothetical protein
MPVPKIPIAAVIITLRRGTREEVTLGDFTANWVYDKNRARDERDETKHCGQVHGRPNFAGPARTLISSDGVDSQTELCLLDNMQTHRSILRRYHLMHGVFSTSSVYSRLGWQPHILVDASEMETSAGWFGFISDCIFEKELLTVLRTVAQ